MKAYEYFELAKSVGKLADDINQNLDRIVKAGGAGLVKLRDFAGNPLSLSIESLPNEGFTTGSSLQNRKVFTLSLSSSEDYSDDLLGAICDTLQVCNSLLGEIYKLTKYTCQVYVEITSTYGAGRPGSERAKLKFYVTTEAVVN